MNVKLNTNAVVTNSKGEILMIKLKKGPFAGGLCIPGGGVIPGELSHIAARREVLEETGIDITSEFVPYGFCELRSDVIDQHKVVMLLHAKGEGMPQETEEGVASWMTYEEAVKDSIPFSKEALRIWKDKGVHFKLVDDEVGLRNVPQKT